VCVVSLSGWPCVCEKRVCGTEGIVGSVGVQCKCMFSLPSVCPRMHVDLSTPSNGQPHRIYTHLPITVCLMASGQTHITASLSQLTRHHCAHTSLAPSHFQTDRQTDSTHISQQTHQTTYTDLSVCLSSVVWWLLGTPPIPTHRQYTDENICVPGRERGLSSAWLG